MARQSKSLRWQTAALADHLPAIKGHELLAIASGKGDLVLEQIKQICESACA
jgi:hypothetical protein